MFNWRIETFNNLLHLDLQTFNYATGFDTNLNLTYDFRTFSKFDRKISNHGMRNIFKNLLLAITEMSPIQCESDIETSNDNCKSNEDYFFRI